MERSLLVEQEAVPEPAMPPQAEGLADSWVDAAQLLRPPGGPQPLLPAAAEGLEEAGGEEEEQPPGAAAAGVPVAAAAAAGERGLLAGEGPTTAEGVGEGAGAPSPAAGTEAVATVAGTAEAVPAGAAGGTDTAEQAVAGPAAAGAGAGEAARGAAGAVAGAGATLISKAQQAAGMGRGAAEGPAEEAAGEEEGEEERERGGVEGTGLTPAPGAAEWERVAPAAKEEEGLSEEEVGEVALPGGLALAPSLEEVSTSCFGFFAGGREQLESRWLKEARGGEPHALPRPPRCGACQPKQQSWAIPVTCLGCGCGACIARPSARLRLLRVRCL